MRHCCDDPIHLDRHNRFFHATPSVSGSLEACEPFLACLWFSFWRCLLTCQKKLQFLQRFGIRTFYHSVQLQTASSEFHIHHLQGENSRKTDKIHRKGFGPSCCELTCLRSGANCFLCFLCAFAGEQGLHFAANVILTVVTRANLSLSLPSTSAHSDICDYVTCVSSHLLILFFTYFINELCFCLRETDLLLHNV